MTCLTSSAATPHSPANVVFSEHKIQPNKVLNYGTGRQSMLLLTSSSTCLLSWLKGMPSSCCFIPFLYRVSERKGIGVLNRETAVVCKDINIT